MVRHACVEFCFAFLCQQDIALGFPVVAAWTAVLPGRQEKKRVQQILVECLDYDIPRLERTRNPSKTNFCSQSL